ncbi:MAG: AAA family ATPase [Gemmatimonadetes bacterium]|nr:AAA family ATPase [Gemmatimonadota bacterium]
MPEPAASPPRPLITIAGDIIIDHHLYEGERRSATSDGVRGVAEVRDAGGAALIKKLLDHIRPEAERNSIVLGTSVPSRKQHGSQHAFAVWKPVRRESGDKNSPFVWRAGLVMGYGQDERLVDTSNSGNTHTPVHHPLPTTTELSPRVLVLDDAGIRFRHKEHEACWLLPNDDAAAPDWIVLKTSAPIAQGDLWTQVSSRFADRLVCIVSAADLRREQLQLGDGLSWERSIEEVRAGLATSPTIAGLQDCRHLIITFSLDGALWIDRSRATPEATLICDAAAADGEFARRIEGQAFGFLSCMVASVANALAIASCDGAKPALASAIAAGLDAMRNLLHEGHGLVSAESPTGYPAQRLARVVVTPSTSGSDRSAPHRLKPAFLSMEWTATPGARPTDAPPWMIVETSQRPRDSHIRPSLTGLARQLVLRGPGVLGGVPHASFGKLLTADRTEIEALRSIRRAMERYRLKKAPRRPLSIGVFGPPGAGKSFGVKELAKDIYGENAWMEFNLSQFGSERDLIGAFHQARDVVLGNITPVVFWDEFDSREFKWLQLLLAPMQDSRFQDGNLTHAVGKCVFVFAGGTRHSYDEFARARGTPEEHARFVLAKGPDFASRLDEYLDVLGPNQRTLPPDDATTSHRRPDHSDVCHPLRRAILIRSFLASDRDARLDIDSDLLDALLEVEEYSNGARSLEKLVRSLQPDASGAIRRSALPPPRGLAMHVDSGKFQDILSRNKSFRMAKVVELLAPEIHESWRQGTTPAKLAEKPHLDRPYAELALADKDDNRAAARRIPDVLALAGLHIVDLANVEADDRALQQQVGQHIEHHIERLSEAEHEGWMEHKTRQGWKFGDKRDDAAKRHPSLIPYHILSESDKDYDRKTVRSYVKFVSLAGYVIRFREAGI